ncbi:30S ribosomal protein S8 [Candidatus Saccharibacteria bacterium RIFCSPLOWO2_01_FULL_48_13]|nr:MAG: 30S ribosomal protein S8 [Candidatus Saccharibacteria bacterium RIFCSPHIGHO2_01_FULL_48_12]OGL35328.1 MAG: 30S ribosomal protein S8 [Candidatus Saccharibacteria bacterium RIFCSPHIGHO2_12_FULL_48_21]OGL37563.1 MAG: 30S ribosomal protein S8 [Candidatus Saccharibacteria bacterium RIFCSPLOWO2_01_FULL_48_13]
MVSTDPIADMLSRIRNAASVNKTDIWLPHSQLKQQIAQILVDNGFLVRTELVKEKDQQMLHIAISDNNQPIKISEIERMSRPGRRMYTAATAIPVVKRGRGIVVISTSKGIMTGRQAKDQKLGGELICKVY